eukprot:PhF_6_TR26409/c1_g3_i1/m.38177
MSTILTDVWFMVFEFSSTHDVARTFNRINRRAYSASIDDVFWRMALVRDGQNDARLVRIVEQYKGPRSFRALYQQRLVGQGKSKKGYQRFRVMEMSFACPLVWSDLTVIKGVDPELKRHCDICSERLLNIDHVEHRNEEAKCIRQGFRRPNVFFNGVGEYKFIDEPEDVHLGFPVRRPQRKC